MKKLNYYSTKRLLLDQIGFESNPELLELFIDKLCKKLKIDEFAACQPIKDKVSKVFNLQYTGTGVDIMLEIVSREVEAMHRKFRAIIDLDSMDRSTEVYGEYMKNQYINFMATEVAYEIQIHLLGLMYRNSTTVNYRIDLVKDSPMAIIHKLQHAANTVAVNSKRGVGNKIILTKEIFERIKDFLPNFEEYGSDECDIQFMGGSALGDIFVSTHSTVVMVHYKGAESEVDSNIIFSPYAFSNRASLDKTLAINTLSISTLYNLIALNSDYTVSLQVR